MNQLDFQIARAVTNERIQTRRRVRESFFNSVSLRTRMGQMLVKIGSKLSQPPKMPNHPLPTAS